jgi:hypothetical protein
MMKRSRALLAGAALLVMASGSVATATTASAATGSGSATITGQAGSYVVGPESLTLPTVGAPALRGPSVVMFSLASPGHWFQVWFAPPAGEALHLGAYEGAQRADFRAAGHPGIDLFGDGRGCNTLTGRFTVDRLRLDPTGLPVVFSARFEFNCEGFFPTISGSIDYTGSFRSYMLSTDTADFGAVRNRGTIDRSVTVTNDGTEPLSIVLANIAGTHASDFAIVANGCEGIALAPAGSCTLTVRFRPLGRPGARDAVLTVFDDAGAGKDVHLVGSLVPPGRA